MSDDRMQDVKGCIHSDIKYQLELFYNLTLPVLFQGDILGRAVLVAFHPTCA